MMQYLQSFFSPSHLWSLRPQAMTSQAAIILAVVFGLFIIFGIFSKLRSNRSQSGLDKKGWNKWFNLGMTIGILGFIYIFFAVQAVTLLAARFWILIILAVALVWAFFILKYFRKELPNRKQEIAKQKDLKKYIP